MEKRREEKNYLEENFSDQHCNHTTFDKYSGVHKCMITESLTVCFIMNPFEKIIKIYYLCQTHSDISLSDYIYGYVKLSQEILELKKARSNYYLNLRTIQYKNYKTNDDLFNIKKIQISVKESTQAIEQKAELKNKISNFQCRNSKCMKEIKKGTPRIILDFIHALGNERHYLYFCSNLCLNEWEKFAMVKTPIIQPLMNY